MTIPHLLVWRIIDSVAFWNEFVNDFALNTTSMKTKCVVDLTSLTIPVGASVLEYIAEHANDYLEKKKSIFQVKHIRFMTMDWNNLNEATEMAKERTPSLQTKDAAVQDLRRNKQAKPVMIELSNKNDLCTYQIASLMQNYVITAETSLFSTYALSGLWFAPQDVQRVSNCKMDFGNNLHPIAIQEIQIKVNGNSLTCRGKWSYYGDHSCVIVLSDETTCTVNMFDKHKIRFEFSGDLNIECCAACVLFDILETQREHEKQIISDARKAKIRYVSKRFFMEFAYAKIPLEDVK